MKKLLFVLLVIIGCSNELSIEKVEEYAIYNVQDKDDVLITNMDLVRVTENQYIGTFLTTKGEEYHIEVVFDTENMWCEWILN